MHDHASSTSQRKGPPVTIQFTQQGSESVGTLSADALSELARLALEGASRVELAACATSWLERMVPGCRAVVVEAAQEPTRQ